MLYGKDGSVYLGAFQKGKPHGTGTLYYPNQDVYEGNSIINNLFLFKVNSSSEKEMAKGSYISVSTSRPSRTFGSMTGDWMRFFIYLI